MLAPDGAPAFAGEAATERAGAGGSVLVVGRDLARALRVAGLRLPSLLVSIVGLLAVGFLLLGQMGTTTTHDVIVRNMVTRSQDTMKIAKLAEFLKAMK